METTLKRNYLFIPPAPAGYITDLAREVGVKRQTVRNALYTPVYTAKAEKIRFIYYERYIKPYLENAQVTLKIN